jgi:thiol-disulfide isomerase/thioredoxin
MRRVFAFFKFMEAGLSIKRSIITILLSSVVGFTATAQEPKPEDLPKNPKVAEQVKAVLAEYQAKMDAWTGAIAKAKDQREVNELGGNLYPDDAAFCRRLIDLALTNPKDPASRDALVWIIDKPGQASLEDYEGEFTRAATLLVLYHGDDPEAVCVGLNVDNMVSSHGDKLLYGFYASAKSRQAKGLARLALGSYLVEKAQFVEVAKAQNGKRRKNVFVGVVGDDGKPHDVENDESDEEYAYELQLRFCDPAALKAEAERLLKEVVAEYSDVPYVSTKHRELEAILKQPTPTWNGKALTKDELKELETMVRDKGTLGEYAETKLDEIANIGEGKPAPEIVGVDIEGKPLKLSDYRGKVVALVFWGSWCGPCMREVPRERELVEKFQGKPFAMLGVNCNETKEAALKAIQAEKMTWPNWHDEKDEQSSIQSRYHIRSYPTIMVIDAKGIIRAKGALGDGLDTFVEELLKEIEPKKDAGK